MKSFSFYGSRKGGVPLILVNTFQNDGRSEWEALRQLKGDTVSFVVVHGLDWNGDLTPYPAQPIFKGDAFLGHGEEHLAYLENEVLPTVVKSLQKPPLWFGIAGYSLAGLFACSTLFWPSSFTRVVSASGSLWYPGFLDYAVLHQKALKPSFVSLSLGDKESQSRNPVLASVGTKTDAFASFLKMNGIPVSFEWNPGSHYSDPDGRLARAIAHLL